MKATSLLFVLALAASAQADSTINVAQPHAWSANLGWTNWRPNLTDGIVTGEYVCSGYVWSANVGWIHFGDGTPVDGIRYTNNSAADYGVNVLPDGTLRGCAYGANIGWVNFEATGNPHINRTTGKLQGYAWGANVGWIVLDDMGTNYVATTQIVAGADSDGDGITDAWERERAPLLATLTATGDADGDGLSDLAEYLADTNPTDASENLKTLSLAITPSSTQTTLAWSGKSTRRYYIESRTDMTSGSWTEIGVGALPGTTGTMSLVFAQPASSKCFYRVRAQRFLP